ncbi:unnamed protein product [Lepidochelys olivacea]
MLFARGLHDLDQEAENNTVSNFLCLWRLKDATMSCAISRSKLQWLLSVSNGKTNCSASQEHLLSYFLVGQRKCIGTNQYCGRREMTLVLITKREEINTLNVSFTASSFDGYTQRENLFAFVFHLFSQCSSECVLCCICPCYNFFIT